MFSSPTTPAYQFPPERTSTPSSYLRFSFPLPDKRYVGCLACQRDPLLTTLDAEVVRCETRPKKEAAPAGKGKKAPKAAAVADAPDEWEVELMDTVIFPEGGGQTSDKGTFQLLSASGEPEGAPILVREAFRRNLSAIHVVSAPLEVGRVVRIQLDVENRRDLMCQHTGQHLLSGMIDNLFGSQLDTLSWSLTPAPQPCYIELPRAPTPAEIETIQQRCNNMILSASPITVEMKLAGQEGTATPSKLPSDYKGEEGEEGIIRSVEIAGLNDRNPCCGTHYPSLSFLQSIFVLPTTSSIRGTNARLYFLVGPRVLAYLSSSHSIVREASLELGCASTDLSERVSALQISARDSARREKKLREEVAGFVAVEMWREATTGDTALSAVHAVSLREDDATNSLDFLSQVGFALKVLTDEAGTTSYLFTLACCSSPLTTPASGALLVIGSSDDLVARAGKGIATAFGAKVKGGGKGRWQGKLAAGRWERGDKVKLKNIVEDAIAAVTDLSGAVCGSLPAMTNAWAALTKLWTDAALPSGSLSHIHLRGVEQLKVPSTFLLGDVAQSSIAASGLAAAQILAFRSSGSFCGVSVSAEDAFTEFRSEQLATLDGQIPKAWDELAGFYRTRDGYIRPHTNWKHHKNGMLRLLGLPSDAKRDEVEAAFLERSADETAEAAMNQGLVITALRSFEEWDAHPQGIAAAARTGGPITLEKLNERPPKAFPPSTSSKPLEGVKILDLTRVIAGPTAGRTLAGYGADVLWVTASHLPSLPNLDFGTSVGKRTVQLDIRPGSPDRAAFVALLRDADVLLQAYRPGGLASLGFSIPEILVINPDIVYASLSAWGPDGPWANRKGFDSLVQVAVGIDEAEGRAYSEFNHGTDFSPKALPCQALDHASGYLLAFGIQAALHRRAIYGGAHKVENSLLSTATWVRSLGRAPPSSFAHTLPTTADVRARGGMEKLVRRDGTVVEGVRHAARFEGAEVGWRYAPDGLNSDQPEWL